MLKHRARAAFIIIIAAAVGYFVYASNDATSKHAFHLGLDLRGGTHLVYSADVSKLTSTDVADSMTALRNVVENRVNQFGVSEPLVQTEQSTALSNNGSAYKLIVELPGVTNIDDAIKSIGATPVLEFKLVTADEMRTFASSSAALNSTSTDVTKDPAYLALFKDTGLTGRMVAKASVEFNQTTNAPIVGLSFTSDGRDLFGTITKNHIGDYLGIFLDGKLISAPVIRDAILDGKGQISGNFKIEEVQSLVRDLNFGALPVPISLISSQAIGPSLGAEAVNGGIKAGVIAFIIIAIFLIAWYRLPGFIATVALGVYITLSLAIFKLGVSPTVIIFCIILMFLAMRYHWGWGAAAIIFYGLMTTIDGVLSPVTLTAAGIAGFILSIGMAVDANILIFERMKEELARGRTISDAMHEGFARAWTSIRDSNISSFITGFVLYFFGSTSIVTGFALVFVVGVMVSMFTAITVSRLLLYAVAPAHDSKFTRFLISNGFRKSKNPIN